LRPTTRKGRSCHTGGVSGALVEWTVAAALVETDAGLLLVRNERRGGWSDWSPPGGVIDAHESVLGGLAREVVEETGIRVARWEGPVYEVRAIAPDMGWSLRVEVHRALEFDGDLRVDDPDGIVVDAVFVPHLECGGLIEGCARWVREPLAEWLAERWDAQDSRGYGYAVRGTRREYLHVQRTDVA
jgi:ADP-ribose pyrophosphatase YjhB (NUDIX family)